MKKRPYAKPILKRYGVVAALTQAVGMMVMAMADGGMGTMNKTS